MCSNRAEVMIFKRRKSYDTTSYININKNTYHSTFQPYWVWNLPDLSYLRSTMSDLFLNLGKFTRNEFLKSVTNWSRVFSGRLSVHDMFSKSKLLSLLHRNLSTTLVCLMSKQANLDIYVSLFPYILQPITYMLKSSTLCHIVDDYSPIHASIVTISVKNDLMVSDL